MLVRVFLYIVYPWMMGYSKNGTPIQMRVADEVIKKKKDYYLCQNFLGVKFMNRDEHCYPTGIWREGGNINLSALTRTENSRSGGYADL